MINNGSLDFRENSSIGCCCFLHLLGGDNTSTAIHDTKIKAAQLPKTPYAKRHLLPLKVGQILPLNHIMLLLLTVSFLTTTMYNTVLPTFVKPVLSLCQATVLLGWKWLLLTYSLKYFQPCSLTERNSYRKQFFPLVHCSGVRCAVYVERWWDHSFC